MPSLRSLAFVSVLLDLVGASVKLDFQQQRRSSSLPSFRRRSLSRRDSVQASLQNAQTNTLYLLNVTVGSPGQNLMLQLDTGSSDIWVPVSSSDICSSNDNPCTNGAFNTDESNTLEVVNEDFDISYVDGTQVKGDYIRDNFGVGGITIKNMTMGTAIDAQGNSIEQSNVPFQGIVGVGFQAGESVEREDQFYPNIIAMLKSQGHTDSQAYSLWLNDLEASTGSILFGAIDNSKFHGDIVSLPIQPDQQSNTLSSFTVVLDNMNVESGKGRSQYSKSNMKMPVILDSGTTLTYLPDDIVDDILIGVGAGYDDDAGIYVDCALMNSPATFNFGFGNPNGPKIQVQISEFVIPYQTTGGGNPTLNDGTEICQWGINPAGDSPNLFGDTFLRSAYVVYDLQNKQVGIAQTVFNSSDTDVKDISSSIPNVSSTATGDLVTQTFSGPPGFRTDAGSGAETIALNFGEPKFDLSGSGTRSGSGSPGPVQAPSSSFVTVMAFGITALTGISGFLMVWL